MREGGALRDARAHETGTDDRDVARRGGLGEPARGGFPLLQPEQEQGDEAPSHGARRELAEGARLRIEARRHATRQADLHRGDGFLWGGVVATCLLRGARAGLRERERARRPEPGRGALGRGGSPAVLALATTERAVAGGAVERRGLDHLVHQTGAQGAPRAQTPRVQDVIEGPWEADETREPLRPAARGEQPEGDLGKSDPHARCVSGDAPVARQRELVPAAERAAVDRRDGDERERRELVRETLHRSTRFTDLGGRWPRREEREIGAADELIRLRARDDQSTRPRPARIRHRIEQRGSMAFTVSVGRSMTMRAMPSAPAGS